MEEIQQTKEEEVNHILDLNVVKGIILRSRLIKRIIPNTSDDIVTSYARQLIESPLFEESLQGVNLQYLFDGNILDLINKSSEELLATFTFAHIHEMEDLDNIKLLIIANLNKLEKTEIYSSLPESIQTSFEDAYGKRMVTFFTNGDYRVLERGDLLLSVEAIEKLSQYLIPEVTEGFPELYEAAASSDYHPSIVYNTLSEYIKKYKTYFMNCDELTVTLIYSALDSKNVELFAYAFDILMRQDITTYSMDYHPHHEQMIMEIITSSDSYLNFIESYLQYSLNSTPETFKGVISKFTDYLDDSNEISEDNGAIKYLIQSYLQ